jgi:hypothetical protein
MNATTLLIGSIVWYALLTLAFACEHNIGKTLYFFGAFILTVGVFIME